MWMNSATRNHKLLYSFGRNINKLNTEVIIITMLKLVINTLMNYGKQEGTLKRVLQKI